MKDELLKTGFAACLALALFTTDCQKKIGDIPAELQARFEKEGIAHRADDLIFRRTRLSGDQDGSWDEKQASIMVTSARVFLHQKGHRCSKLRRAQLASTRSTARKIASVCAQVVVNRP